MWGYGGDDTMNGGKGNDTMRGGRGDDTMDGSWGNDTLRGGRGEDRLIGGRGDDTLTGGAWDADTFVFGGNSNGHDTITDFGSMNIYDINNGNIIETDRDKIEIRGGTTFSDLTITNNAEGDAVITGYADDSSITLEDVSASELTESDFIFVA
ncbi:hypothetical protein [Nitratireductor sp. XY-223]|uniref:calcium-binding protein n=1 Tax=Nitratireductor sp. XY-223 TaxID=2561926 RepID=UPI0032B13A0A